MAIASWEVSSGRQVKPLFATCVGINGKMKISKEQNQQVAESFKQIVKSRIDGGEDIEYSDKKVKAKITHDDACTIETLDKIELSKNDEIKLLESNEKVYFRACRPHKSLGHTVSYKTQATYEKQKEG